MTSKTKKTSDKVNVGESEEKMSALTATKVQTTQMNNVIIQMMTMDGKELRTVFDKAIEDYNARVNDVKNTYEADMEAVGEEMIKCDADIIRYEDAIRRAETSKRGLIEQQNEINEKSAEQMNKLDEQRLMIENMQSLFKAKLDGFNDA